MNKYVTDALTYAGQGSELWEKMRLGKFTASGIGALMTEPRSKADKDAGKLSQTAYKYVIEKAIEAITGQSHDESYGRAIDWGNEWESHSLDELNKALLAAGHVFTMEKKPAFKLFNEYSGASADALLTLDDGSVIGVEIKNPFNPVNHYIHATVSSWQELADVNSDYYYQILFNMVCYGCTSWYFASYDGRQIEHRRLHYVHLVADDAILSEMAVLCDKVQKAEAHKQQIVTDWVVRTNK